MKKVIIILVIIALGLNLFAQNSVEKILAEIEKNNTTLSSLRKSVDAQKIGNKTGIYLQNPEAEFNFLWGNPSAIGNRNDLSIKQSFDFPSVYSYKYQISDLKNEQSELEYKRQRNELMYQIRVICVNLLYKNALTIELQKRYVNTLKIVNAYKTKFNTGDMGILDYNKVQVNLLNITKEMENNEIERNALMSALATLNGGAPVHFNDSVFINQAIHADFDQWYTLVEANNPLLQWIKQEIAISEKQVKLNTAMNLPKFNAGYMSEKVVGELFQGLTLGITIPLWENKNMVKYANANSVAIQSMEADAKLQFYENMKAIHIKVIALQNSIADYYSKLSAFNNSLLLDKAFSKGEISLTEYMYELSLYYESMYKLLEMERNLHLAYAELIRYQ
jgi:outer membrane protein, heavy metal efflux system